MAKLRRQKKMRFDPGARHRGKNSSAPRAPRRPEQIFLTRRVLLARGIIAAALTTLASRLGYMQLVKGEGYRDQARANVQAMNTIKAPRGLIYDAQGRLLADNRKSWEVRLIPRELPTDTAERQMVLDQLITTLSLPDVLTIEPDAIPETSVETVHATLVATMVAMGMLEEGSEAAELERLKTESRRNYLVLVDDDLSVDEAAQFRALKGKLPGVTVMNYVDYMLGNAPNRFQPISLKVGIPKETALKLEANKHLLPGVVLDDSVLVRRYHGGEVMAHVLGYARRMTAELFEDLQAEREDDGAPIYAEDDIIGQGGIEFTLEPELRGRKGREWVTVNAMRVVQRVIDRKDPNPGNNIKLNLDLKLQQAVSAILQDAINFSNEDRKAKLEERKARDPERYKDHKFHRAMAGSVVAVDPRDGRVLALVSLPHFDNQLFVDGISQRKVNEYNDEKRAGAPLLNRAIAARFPSGSTIKPFLAVNALRDRGVTETTTFTCTGGIRIPEGNNEAGGQQFPCWQLHGHESLDLYAAIERSCDVYFYNLGVKTLPLDNGKKLHYYDVYYNADTREITKTGESHEFKGVGIDKIKKGLVDRFWFMRATGIELPGEYEGIIPDPVYAQQFLKQDWSPSATANVSIGQGQMQITPLQLAVNCAAIANRGKVWRPHLVAEISDAAGKVVKTIRPKLLREMKVRPDHFDAVREGMRRVVHSPDGSAHHVFVDNVQVTKWPETNPEGEPEIVIGGKTGTAETGKTLEDGTYDRQHCWFMCFAPYDEPEIALAVVIEDGGEGSSYAVPVADKTLRAFFEITGRRTRKLLKQESDAAKPENGDEADPILPSAETPPAAPDQPQD